MSEFKAAPLEVPYPDAIVQNAPGGVRITGVVVVPGRPQPAVGPDGRQLMSKGPNGTPVPITMNTEPQRRPLCTWFEPGVRWVHARPVNQEDAPTRVWLVPLDATLEQVGLVEAKPEAASAPAKPLIMQ